MSAVHQATCVAIADAGILIEGPPGSGKSSLALALIDRGAVLVGDDGVLLEAADGALFARPPPATRGLIEVRNVGILTFPVRDDAGVAMVIALAADAPRLPCDDGESCERGGVALPLVRMAPHDPVLPIKAELALRRFAVR